MPQKRPFLTSALLLLPGRPSGAGDMAAWAGTRILGAESLPLSRPKRDLRLTGVSTPSESSSSDENSSKSTVFLASVTKSVRFPPKPYLRRRSDKLGVSDDGTKDLFGRGVGLERVFEGVELDAVGMAVTPGSFPCLNNAMEDSIRDKRST
jgi:hypothetical protein